MWYYCYGFFIEHLSTTFNTTFNIMHLGNLQIHLLDTGDFALDGGAMFGVVPRNLWMKAYHAPDEQNRIPMKALSLLVRGEFDGKHKTILVDTGNGHKWPDKLAAIYKIDNTHTTLAASLARHDLTTDDVTDVILTHLHFDHAGGATTLASGKLQPTFPNARYYVQKEQFAWAQQPADKDRASFMKDDFMPLAAEGVLELLDGDGELFAGISVMQVHGHTRSLQAVKIQHGSDVLLYPADLIPTSAHVPVPYVMAYDNHPLTTIEEKKRILPQAADEGWTVVYEHDAFVQASTIVATDKGFARGEERVISA
jgi:glyoxylase-like metal-dependent hydrolase (beta-lactamase superfamily II)